MGLVGLHAAVVAVGSTWAAAGLAAWVVDKSPRWLVVMVVPEAWLSSRALLVFCVFGMAVDGGRTTILSQGRAGLGHGTQGKHKGISAAKGNLVD